MRSRAVALSLVAVVGCTGGLYENQGNDFPCDFTQPPGVRDLACAPGEVCGVDNLCRAFRYEGPQFEFEPYRPHGAPLPDFDGGVTLLHPGLLNQPILEITRRGDRPVLDQAVLLMGTPGNATAAVVTLDLDVTVTTTPFTQDVGLMQSVAVPGDWVAVVELDRTSIASFDDLNQSTGFVKVGALPLDRCDRLRTGVDVEVVLRTNGTLTDPSTAGEFHQDGVYTALDFTFDAGVTYHPLEARYLPASPVIPGFPQDLLMLSDLGFVLRQGDMTGTHVNVTAPNTDFPADLVATRPTLRHDTTGSIWAFTREGVKGGRRSRPGASTPASTPRLNACGTTALRAREAASWRSLRC